MKLRSIAAGVLLNFGLISFALGGSSAWAFQLEVAEAPSTTLSLTVSAIQSARKTLLLNIYELSSSEVAAALMERIQSGVKVEIIEEGQPVGGISAAGRGIQSELAQAMRAAKKGDHFFEMTSKATAKVKRRFRYDHGKYAVIDGINLLIGSENYSPSGNPEAGTKGNRGWEVFIHNEAIAREYEAVFRKDTDMSSGDMVDLTTQASPAGLLDYELDNLNTGQNGDDGDNDNTYAHPTERATPVYAPWTDPVTLEASSVRRITSPETSLAGLLKMINEATTTLDIEQMTFDSGWGKDADESPLLTAVVAAANRGVQVRVLLNDESVFDHSSHPKNSKNKDTVDYINSLSANQGANNISAHIADIHKMGVSYIHNKGVLVDGTKTLISSINWNNNSVTNNREAAVLITSPAVNEHYTQLFESDWKLSGGDQPATSARRRTSAAITMTLRPVTNSEMDDCPTRLHISALIGTLHIVDADDASFEFLSNTRIESDFAKTAGARGCVLTDLGAPASRAGKGRFIQFRKKTDGSHTATLEGYTPTGKVYSIRSLLPAESRLDGQFNGTVFNGSGPSREKLGAALLEFTTTSEE